MQKYGMLVGGNLLLNSEQLEGYKHVVYAEIPSYFDQTTQYVVQSEPVEDGERIFIGIEIRQLELDEGDEFGEQDIF